MGHGVYQGNWQLTAAINSCPFTEDRVGCPAGSETLSMIVGLEGPSFWKDRSKSIATENQIQQMCQDGTDALLVLLESIKATRSLNDVVSSVIAAADPAAIEGCVGGDGNVLRRLQLLRMWLLPEVRI